MQVTNEQLDKAAQAARKVAADDLGLTTKWDDLSMQAMDFYRKQALTVLATLPDAPEPIEGKRRFVAARLEYGSWEVMEKQAPGDYRHYGASFSNELPADCAAAMIRAAADAAERWHRAQMPTGPKRWRVEVKRANDVVGTAYGAVGPHSAMWLYASEGWAYEDAELLVNQRNARLDAEEGRNG